MIIRTRISDVSEEELRPVDRMLRLFLARFSPLVASVHITLAGGDTAGSSRCRVHVRLRDGATRSVDERAGSLREAADRAVWRLDHHLGRRAKPNTARVDVARRPIRTSQRRF